MFSIRGIECYIALATCSHMLTLLSSLPLFVSLSISSVVAISLSKQKEKKGEKERGREGERERGRERERERKKKKKGGQRILWRVDWTAVSGLLVALQVNLSFCLSLSLCSPSFSFSQLLRGVIYRSHLSHQVHSPGHCWSLHSWILGKSPPRYVAQAETHPYLLSIQRHGRNS